MKSRATRGIAVQLGVIDHAPVVSAVFGKVRCAHVTIEQHEVGIGGGDGRREHAAAAGEADGLPGGWIVGAEVGGKEHCEEKERERSRSHGRYRRAWEG